MRLTASLLLTFFFIPMAVIFWPWEAMDYAAAFLLVTLVWRSQTKGTIK